MYTGKSQTTCPFNILNIFDKRFL